MKLIAYLRTLLRNLFPIFFASQLRQGVRFASSGTPIGIPAGFAIKYHPPFRPPFRTNGASRKKKSNRLRISKMTRNKHR